MKPNTQLLHSVWNKNQDFIAKSLVDLDASQYDELIASIFSNGPFYFYIVDFHDLSIKYMSPLVKEIHGLDPETTTFQDILDQVHPDDMAFVSKAEEMLWDFGINKIGKEKNKKYKYSYCFRFRIADGSYQLFNHQSLLLTTDEIGLYGLALNVHTNISHLTTVNNYQVSMIGILGEPSYLNIGSDADESIMVDDSKALFTLREKEIIRLMSNGSTNKEIGDKLFIAVNTVKNHKKNILQKSGCKNLSQLITKCITEGLI